MPVFVPAVLIAERNAHSAHTPLLPLAALAIVLLVALLGRANEAVAEKTGDAVRGQLVEAATANRQALKLRLRPHIVPKDNGFDLHRRAKSAPEAEPPLFQIIPSTLVKNNTHPATSDSNGDVIDVCQFQ
jgi:hypothetical protein